MAKRAQVNKIIQEWCEAQSQWMKEVDGGGYPRAQTRRRLYHAGRALFNHVSVPYPESGIYEYNWRLERGVEVYE